jgi:hypothetical protein
MPVIMGLSRRRMKRIESASGSIPDASPEQDDPDRPDERGEHQRPDLHEPGPPRLRRQ